MHESEKRRRKRGKERRGISKLLGIKAEVVYDSASSTQQVNDHPILLDWLVYNNGQHDHAESGIRADSIISTHWW
jgi:hypothetical protein